jgi:uncharacterized protein YndB with AHSA1/START domain
MLTSATKRLHKEQAMSHYQQHLVIDADPSAVYAAIATPEGLRGWWTPDCTADTHAGGTAHFRFGDTWKDVSIEQLDMNRGVRWFVTRSHLAMLSKNDEWTGTEIAFRLTPTIDGKTRLDFEHVGLVPSFECYDRCSTGWNYFLASLCQYAETGRGTPWVPAEACAA